MDTPSYPSNPSPTMGRLDDFGFDLPGALIAQYPLATRSASRLLHLGPEGLADRTFGDIVDLLDENDLLITNDTKVIKARFLGQKVSGAKVEVLIERILSSNEAIAHLRANRSQKPGARLLLENCLKATVVDRAGNLYKIAFEDIDDLSEAIAQYGHLPLPPYITRTETDNDEARYQTIFARKPGAVAAPTAGLHFDEPIMTALREKGVKHRSITLHVGSGTFLPIRESLDSHQMHQEYYQIDEATAEAVNITQARGGRIVAVGSTALRALESAADETGHVKAGSAETVLFIRPGYRFRVVDRLITNFHLPKTTLFILVSAFAGMTPVRSAYDYAIAMKYRFFSYGDAMLLEKNDGF